MSVFNESSLDSVEPLTKRYEQQAREVIEAGLREHWSLYDPAMNPDVQHLSQTYGSNMVIGLKNGRVVATGAWINLETGVASIVRMSVAKPYRKQGYTTQILSALENRIVSEGISRVVLETTTQWQDVVRFYTNQGYRFTHIDGDDSYFVKILDPSTVERGLLE
ncbi:GNAT family N-acetyltransferase [Saccharospirillum salsuginis]|uniref:N-acetyltransferase domain-containing protein n=1 Tax=Saccharospirillum salsuginis TaxID=418750 RepID=A0A918NGN3_9GAMM|nr:GNAT family N-acetyltransferase [Saccharospirillum salsuginis]GGX66107.1 hypothetical protein GCM10007392_37180 [Saccharospirillum salsuginis]